MRGVKIVSDSPVSRSAALEDVPNAETLAAMKEGWEWAKDPLVVSSILEHTASAQKISSSPNRAKPLLC